MRSAYPLTYDYMLDYIEQGKVRSLCSFTDSQKLAILDLFFQEVTPLRLKDLNDAHIPDPRLEIAFIHVNNPKFRFMGLSLIWSKYEKELDRILDQAETDNSRAMGCVSDEEDWLNADMSQRTKDIQSEFVQYY